MSVKFRLVHSLSPDVPLFTRVVDFRGLRDGVFRAVENTFSQWVELQQSRRSASVRSIYVFLGDIRSLCL